MYTIWTTMPMRFAHESIIISLCILNLPDLNNMSNMTVSLCKKLRNIFQMKIKWINKRPRDHIAHLSNIDHNYISKQQHLESKIENTVNTNNGILVNSVNLFLCFSWLNAINNFLTKLYQLIYYSLIILLFYLCT